MNHVATELSEILALYALSVSEKQDLLNSHQKGYHLIKSRFYQAFYMTEKSKPLLNPIICILYAFIPAKFLY